MRVEVLGSAEDDIVEGYLFYETQQVGVGTQFLQSIYAEIDSLRGYAGIHRIIYRDYHRLISKRFPFLVFYTLKDEVAQVHAVVDSRRSPAWIRKHLR